ncbi:MAG: GldG family protein, partial [Gammaproteobacteria bacterium]|nr:GldG family protein [Gammaproteobacteria bacterium]
MLNKTSAGTGLLIALALFLGINVISNETLTSLRLDVTDNKLFTLSDGTVNILNDLDEPVRLRFYYSAKLFAGVPQYLNYGKRVRDMLEEYAAESGGKLELQVIDPEPFSEAEDQAVAFGIRQLPFSATGEMAYLGLAGTNSTDDEDVLPFLSPDREDALEYDITKMVYTLANPRKRVIGVLSGLPMFGGPLNPATGAPGQPWTVITVLEELFETRELGTDITTIDDDVDTLMVVHPKALPRSTLYAVDQFILRGGKAIVFVDPLAEEDSAQPNPEAPMVLPDTSSDLPDLFGSWGISLVEGKIVGDRLNAIRVSYRGSRGPQEIEYLPWLRFESANLNGDDFITNQLNVINMGSAGAFTIDEAAATTVTPLIYSSRDSMLVDKDAVLFVRDPSG